MENLKASYGNHVTAFLALNVVVFWAIVISGAESQEVLGIPESISLEQGVIAIVAPTVTLILGGWLPAHVKAVLVYWNWSNPLPGCRAFSEHMQSDLRIDQNAIRETWGPIPDSPAGENQLWYKIFRSVESDPQVWGAHREWLFARDVTGYAAIFLVLLGSATVVAEIPAEPKIGFLTYLAIQYLSAMISARVYGRRFVCNALASASSRAIIGG